MLCINSGLKMKNIGLISNLYISQI
jgi:hypothetical protein